MEPDLINRSESQPASSFKPDNKSNSLVTILSLLLLIASLVAGFFAWQTQNLVKELTIKNEELEKILQSPATLPTETPLDNIDPLPIATPSASSNPSANIACTLEAKLCPDGSSVGRTGPNCEFAPCP